MTRFHPRCGTSFLLVIMVISILIFSIASSLLLTLFPGLNALRGSFGYRLLMIAFKLLLLPLVVGITYEINRWAGRHDNGFTRVLTAPGMLFILLFHVGGRHNETLAYCLSRCGNVGVDIFLFVSGIGLWFAWSKGTTLKQFYWRRYIRVYPAWLVIACLYFIPLYINDKADLTDTILNIIYYHGFWTIYNELHFWYIPAIMTLYTVAPAYMTLLSRSRSWCWLPVVFMLFCIAMRYDQTLWTSLRHIEIFISRIPIFLIGINVGQWVRERLALTSGSQ